MSTTRSANQKLPFNQFDWQSSCAYSIYWIIKITIFIPSKWIYFNLFFLTCISFAPEANSINYFEILCPKKPKKFFFIEFLNIVNNRSIIDRIQFHLSNIVYNIHFLTSSFLSLSCSFHLNIHIFLGFLCIICFIFMKIFWLFVHFSLKKNY